MSEQREPSFMAIFCPGVWPTSILTCVLSIFSQVNMRDVMVAVQAFNSFRGYPRWNADADLDGSGRVTMRDLLIIVLNFNKHE
jgi:hypothetical protein